MTDYEKAQFWHERKEALGFATVWSIWECSDVDMQLLSDKPRLIKYEFIDASATMHQLINDTYKRVTVTAVAKGGKVRDLWEAAESCFQQALALGDHHPYIENFEAQEDGSFELVMGS